MVAALGSAAVVTSALVSPQAAFAFNIFPQGSAILAYADGQTGNLMIRLPGGQITDTHRQVSPGTSPSITGLLVTGHWEVAFREANSQHLWLMGQDLAPRDTGSFIQPNTSPAITTLTNGNFEVAFNGPGNHLFQGDSHSGGDTGSFIAPGTSPSIAPTAVQTYEVTWVGPGNVVWEGGPTGGGHIAANATGGVVEASDGSSPSISGIPGGSFKGPNFGIAIHGLNNFATAIDNTDKAIPSISVVAPGTNMASGANPYTSVPFSYSFQHAGDGHLIQTNSGSGTIDSGLKMRPGSSPASATVNNGTIDAFVNADTGTLWTWNDDSLKGIETGLKVAANTNPSIATLYTVS
ncbi:hypothetical protein [Streptomyces sp. RKAG293]|uniref:hypothetical protein n=1 Tax=Streptomyces sp. RKAG293 TaxID=2893403 RepID=UPI002033A31A|nr:hypothetical protein [Streptomyces sp. RKAG293]MCM2416541.1 hypothetical protein [Streptomyces sp. RKAG293]